MDKSDVIIKRHRFDRNKIPQGPFVYEDFRLDKNPILKKHLEYSELVRSSYAENEYKRTEQKYGMSSIDHFRKIRADSGLPPPEGGYDLCGMPEHLGYKQLCIICEKQGFWDEIINIAEQAKEEGWRGDWDKRIEKAKKKLGQG